MMYIHFCKACNRMHILNGHKITCPACNNSLIEMKITYLDYIHLTPLERDNLLEECQDEATLKSLSTTYRMYKYSKWYKKQVGII